MKTAKSYISYVVGHFVICMLLFWCIQKPLFFFYNWSHGGSECTVRDVMQMYLHGFSLDAAASAYLTVIPLLLAGIWAITSWRRILIVLRVYVGIAACLLSLIILADAALYEFWEFKLDATVFLYLNDPRNAFASVSTGYLLIRLGAWLLLSGMCYALFVLPLRVLGQAEKTVRVRVSSLLAFLVMGSMLFVAIRGIRIYPNSPGRAFYSVTPFHNHTALNPAYNLGYSTARHTDFDEQYRFFTKETRDSLWSLAYYPTSGTTELHLLNVSRPNILLIVLESFGACFVEDLGGMTDVAPNLNRLLQEGVNFAQCYCSSFRTDRGIVATLSGYPGQPTTNIMKYSQKMASLPGLPKSLKQAGYNTTALYGGDVTFFNLSDYLISCGHDRIVSEDDFLPTDRSTKWGVPDHRTFEWLLDEISRKHEESNEPWYTTFLTLSSHEPFDVPYHRLDDVKLNAFAYTDSCLGHFVDSVKQTPAWENLLIVCIADHGYNHEKVASPRFPHIPFLLLGGAVERPCRIEQIVGQTDLAATLLGQLDLPHEDYPFSRDVLSSSYVYPFAFTTYNDGFIFRDSTGCTVFDNVALQSLDGGDEARERMGQLVLQTLYDDLHSR